jgi:hypothetical protein
VAVGPTKQYLCAIKPRDTSNTSSPTRTTVRYLESKSSLSATEYEVRALQKIVCCILTFPVSTLVQSLPPSSFHSGRDHVFETSQFPGPFGREDILSSKLILMTPDYVGLNSLPQESHYNTIPPAHLPLVLGQRQSISPTLRRTSSRGVEAPFKSPSMRDRTPIRHRASLPRDRSVNRQDALLAYVSDQQNQPALQHQQGQQAPVLATQTAPDPSMMFHTPNYNLQSSDAYVPQDLYYQSPPLQHNSSQYMAQSHIFGSDPSRMQYYPLQSSSTHTTTSTGPAFSPQESLYAPPPLSSNTQNSRPTQPSAGNQMIQSSLPTPAPLESSREEFRGSAARPKPQCFEHGCNGREFSTFSNLLRHQRERSGNASKSVCPHCGTEFTRTTARNGHLTSGKCKGKSDGQSGSGSDTGN